MPRKGVMIAGIFIFTLILLLNVVPSFGASKKPAPTSTPSLTAIPNPTTVPTSDLFPSQVLNLTNWKETLPIGSSEKPTEVKQPVLQTYKLDPWFVATDGGKAVRFRAPVNAVTTSGSNYPRSELREMTNNGKTNASLSSTVGTHELFIDQAITQVPKYKKHVVAGQIHDAKDDILVIRLEYPHLFVDVNGDTVKTLDPKYTLGKRFTIKLVVNGGKTSVYYNGSNTPIYTLEKPYSGAYFKAGAYTQSNCSKEKNPSFCADDNYGEVLIYRLTTSHY